MGTKYDLIERVEKYGGSVITFSKQIPRTMISMPIVSQFVRAGTSVGANYCEADNAESRNDYVHKVGIAKKEVKETMYWLKMIEIYDPKLKDKITPIYAESQELNLIFSAIVNKITKKVS